MIHHYYFNRRALRHGAVCMLVGLLSGIGSRGLALSLDAPGGLFGNRGADSAAAPPTKNQTFPALSPADSVKKNAIHDSLIAIKCRAVQLYQEFSDAPDSIFSPTTIRRRAIFSSDAISLSDLAHAFPQMISVPLSLSNGLNRSMPYGFPLPASMLRIRSGLLADPIQSFVGSDFISAAELSEVTCGPGGALTVTPADYDLVVPETQFLWENGLFYENILNVRMARPLSQNLSMSIISNNRYFKSVPYSTKGDVSSLYNNFIKDTNLLVQAGQNPLVAEQNTQLRLFSKGKNGEKAFLNVGYADDQNEVSHGFKDTTGGVHDSLRWDRIFRFGVDAQGGINGLRLSPVGVDLALRLIRQGHTRHELADNKESFGRNAEYAFAVQPSITVSRDTISLRGTFTRHEQTLYTNSTRVGHEADAALAAAGHFTLGETDGDASGELGEHVLDLRNVKTENTWIGSVAASLRRGGGLLRLFARRDVAPYPQRYDSVKTAFGDFFTPFQTFGAEVNLTYKKVGVTAGMCSVTGLDGLDSTQTWPENVLPYRQPRVAWVVAPYIGRWRGFSLSSRWMLQDRRPYLKASNSIGFQAHPLGGKEHILCDLTFDYWSRRDSLTYGGRSDWNREVLNVRLYTAVQIKTFSLFYKIDNILNRSFAYVPGYRMPGMTFRWGFQWLLQG